MGPRQPTSKILYGTPVSCVCHYDASMTDKVLSSCDLLSFSGLFFHALITMPRSTKKRQKQEEEQEPEQPQEQQQTKDEEAPPEKKVKTETDKEERKTEKEAAGAEEDPSKKARVLEKGHIYFLYRPKVKKKRWAVFS